MKTITHLSLIVAFFLVGTGFAARPARGDEPIVLFDLTGLRKLDLSKETNRAELWDTCHLVSALQGLSNRAGPRLYVKFIEPWDTFWLNWLRSPDHWLSGRKLEQVQTLEKLLERFRNSYRGVVLYGQRPDSLSNLASTIAGCENLLPVRKDERPGSLYHRLVVSGPKLQVVVDLTKTKFLAVTGSAKCDAYLWAKRRYLDTRKCDPAYLAYYIDTFWLRDPFRGNHENHTLTNHDYFISKRAFFFDLHPWHDEAANDDPTQKPGTDARTLQSLLLSAYQGVKNKTMIHVGGFVPWAWKYTSHAKGASRHAPVATEWRFAEILSSYNAIMDADALGPCAMSNASFYTHFPLRKKYPQPPSPTVADLKKRRLIDKQGLVSPGAYICFYVGDYDSAAWLYREFPRCWNDPARGKVALGWAVNPNLARRAPMVLAYARETKTPLDIFTAGDSGAGYLNPGGLQTPRRYSGLPSGIRQWEKFCRPFYQRWDLRATGFIIDGDAPPMNQELWDAYARFSPAGIVGQKMAPQGIHKGMPFLRMSSAAGSAKQTADQFAAMISPERRSFYYVRTILKSASWHKQFDDLLRKQQPAARVVDPHTFFALLAEYEKHKASYPRPKWVRDEVSWTPKEEKGLRLIPFSDGPIQKKKVAGREAIVSQADSKAIYIYAAAHDGFSLGKPETLIAEVTYLDTPNNHFSIHYNGVKSAYAGSPGVDLKGSGQWKQATIVLRDSQLANQQNGSCDIRLVNHRGTLAISRIVLRRPKQP